MIGEVRQEGDLNGLTVNLVYLQEDSTVENYSDQFRLLGADLRSGQELYKCSI